MALHMSSFTGSGGSSGAASAGGSLFQSAFAAHNASHEASKNRKFQQAMSNSQYQRAVQDMRAAGLNPILAYKQGGAGTPSGSMASTPPISNPAESYNTARNAATTNKLLQAQINSTDAQAASAHALARKTTAEAKQAEFAAAAPELITSMGQNSAETMNLIRSALERLAEFGSSSASDAGYVSQQALRDITNWWRALKAAPPRQSPLRPPQTADDIIRPPSSSNR